MWGAMPRWGQNLTLEEVRKEEARRLVWSSVILLGNEAAVRVAEKSGQLNLHLSKHQNVSGLPHIDVDTANVDSFCLLVVSFEFYSLGRMYMPCYQMWMPITLQRS